MSTLTKVFIVVIVVFSVMSSVLFMQQALTTPNWRKAWEGERLSKQIAHANLVSRTGENDTLKVEKRELERRGDQQRTSLLAENQNLRDEKSQSQRESLRLQSQLAVKSSQLTAFGKTYDEQVIMTALLTTQVADRDKVNTRQKEQLGLLQKTLRDRDRELVRSNGQLHLTGEQLAEAKTIIEKLNKNITDLRAGGAVAAAPGTGTPSISTSGQAIEGRVTAVDLSHNVCQLNVGSASGVMKNMRFIIYRGDDFVGYLVISDVDEGSSAGVLTDLQMPPQQQDRATSHLNLD